MQKKTPELKIVIFFGLTGSGKSYLAKRWAAEGKYLYLNSDEVRKQLAGVALDSRHHVPFNEGLYSPEMTRRTYQEMLDRGSAGISDKGCAGVVLDGSYGRQQQRQQVVDVFSDRARIFFILCHCTESVTRSRFQLRSEDAGAVSDGRWQIYSGQKRSFSVPDQIEGAASHNIDTDDQIDTLIARVEQIIDR